MVLMTIWPKHLYQCAQWLHYFLRMAALLLCEVAGAAACGGRCPRNFFEPTLAGFSVNPSEKHTPSCASYALSQQWASQKKKTSSILTKDVHLHSTCVLFGQIANQKGFLCSRMRASVNEAWAHNLGLCLASRNSFQWVSRLLQIHWARLSRIQ
jgi:hypothetical protein